MSVGLTMMHTLNITQIPNFAAPLTLSVIVLATALMILAHHYIKHKYVCDLEDINNHETIALTLIALAIGILIGFLMQ